MGRKIVQATIIISGVGSLLSLISLLLPMHSMMWFVGGLVPVLKINTHVLTVATKNCDSSYSKMMPFCNDMESHSNLQDFAIRGCSSVISNSFANLCEGLYYAYIVGFMLLIVVIMNCILQGAAVYALNYYIVATTRKKYRKLASVLQVIGVGMVCLVHSIYFCLPLLHLSDVRPRGPLQMFFSSGSSMGVSYGYILLWVAQFVQLFAIVLSHWAKTSSEERMEELREQAKFEEAMEGSSVEMSNNCYAQQGMQMGMQQPGMHPGMPYGGGGGGFQQPQFGGMGGGMGFQPQQQPAMPGPPPAYGFGYH